jgi:hypothetical protein
MTLRRYSSGDYQTLMPYDRTCSISAFDLRLTILLVTWVRSFDGLKQKWTTYYFPSFERWVKDLAYVFTSSYFVAVLTPLHKRISLRTNKAHSQDILMPLEVLDRGP